MNHRIHREKKIACDTCHNSSVTNTMREVGLATRLQLPKMDTCLTCHDGKTASAACSTCHVSDKTGRIAQQFSSGILRPMQGDPSAWIFVLLLSQLLFGAAIAVTWARYRWGVWQAWLSGGPVLLAVGVAITDQAAKLLPNLM